MVSGSTDRPPPRHPAGLILRVSRPGGRPEEFYLAPGLTIGRTRANTVVLDGDDSVDRAHARVEVAADGAARLACVGPDATLTIDGATAREVPLVAGVRFRIGRAEFRCVAGRRMVDDAPTGCPFCGAEWPRAEGSAPFPCPGCGNPVLPVAPDGLGSVPALAPAVYGEYRAERLAARGGMGLVLLGARPGGGRVAIKILPPGQGVGREDADRFRREVATMSRVRHPNVVRLLACGKTGGLNYLVLEWIDGPSLREAIDDANRAGVLPDFAAALRRFEQICKGLAAIHAVGLVHRDVKPSNILIDVDGVAKVADFGIAGRVDAGRTSAATGSRPGTFGYMAPELMGGPGVADGRADLYSLGVTFYEVLAGTRPVGAWRPASAINGSVPAAFDEVLGRLLAPGAEDRYADIHELMAAMSAFRPALRPTPPRPHAPPASDRSRMIRLAFDPLTRTPPQAPPAIDRPGAMRRAGRRFGHLRAKIAPVAASAYRAAVSTSGRARASLRSAKDRWLARRPPAPVPAPTSTASAAGQDGERARIARDRSRYNGLALITCVAGLGLRGLASLIPTAPAIGVAVHGGIALLAVAFGLAAMCRGQHPLLGVYCFLSLHALQSAAAGGTVGLLVVAALMVAALPDRTRARLDELDAGTTDRAEAPIAAGRFPRYFWRSTLSCVIFPLAPVSLWLAIRGYRERPDKGRVPPLAVAALAWTGLWTLACLVLYGALLLGGLPADAGAGDQGDSPAGETRVPAAAAFDQGAATGSVEPGLRSVRIDGAIRLGLTKKAADRDDTRPA